MYLIRSKARPLRMRDLGDNEMKEISTRKWVPFLVLPHGIPVTGDTDVEIKNLDCPEGDQILALCEAEDERMKEEGKLADKAVVDRRKAEAEKMEADLEARETKALGRTPEELAEVNAKARGLPSPKALREKAEAEEKAKEEAEKKAKAEKEKKGKGK